MRRPMPQGLGTGRHEASEGVARHQLEHRPRLFAFELIFVEIARLLVREIVELVERFTLGAVQQVRAHRADREIAADPLFDENFEIGAIGGADFLADHAVIGRALLAVRRAEGDAPRRDVLDEANIIDIVRLAVEAARSEEHTSELQSLMRISYAGFCLKKNKT